MAVPASFSLDSDGATDNHVRRSGYKYYLTRLGRRAIAAALRLREGSVIPALAGLPA